MADIIKQIWNMDLVEAGIDLKKENGVISVNTNGTIGDNAGYAFVEGDSTFAKGYDSHAEGYGSTAYASYSHAEGYATEASGDRSHAGGNGSVTSGTYSFAHGNSASALGLQSIALGYKTLAQGQNTFVVGSENSAYGSNSHAEGCSAIASGDYSYAMGFNTSANGAYSHAEGNYTIADSQYMYVIGSYNKTSSDALFVVGNGYSLERSDAFIVSSNGTVSAKKFISVEPSPIIFETISNEDLPDVTIHNNVFSVIPATPSSINVVVPAGELCNSICQFTASANGNMPTFIMNGVTNFKINAGSISTVTQDKTYQVSFLNDCCTIAEFKEQQ